MITVTNGTIIKAVAGVIYEMHPYHAPENMGILMEHVVGKLDAEPDFEGNVDKRIKIFRFNDYRHLKDFVTHLLNHEVFEDLNTSRASKESDIEDSKIRYITRYSNYGFDTRYTDFVDLDACIGNICNFIENNTDCKGCFLCKYAKEYFSDVPSNCDKCHNCVNNVISFDYYEPHPLSLKPRKEWTDEEIAKYNIKDYDYSCRNK